MISALTTGRRHGVWTSAGALAWLLIQFAPAPAAGSVEASEALGLELPAQLRVTLTGVTDSNPFGPLAGLMVIDSLPGRRGVQLSIEIDPPEQVGALVWPPLSPVAAASSDRPFESVVEKGRLEITLRPSRYQFQQPTWIFARGQDSPGFSSADLVTAWARQGSVRLRVRDGRVAGKIRLSGPSDLSGRPITYLAQIVGRVPSSDPPGGVSAALAKTAAKALDSAPMEDLPPAMRERDEGDELRSGGSFRAAAERYEEALALYREEAESASYEVSKHNAWISERGIVSRLIFCYTQLGEIEKVISGLTDLTDVDRRLRQVPYLRRLVDVPAPVAEGSPAMIIEGWLSRLSRDHDRIEILEKSQRFFEAYALYLAHSHTAVRDALEVSELARARAFATLLAERGGSVLPPEPVSVEQMLDVVARRRSLTLEYLVTERQLVTWVITPSGEVQASFSEVGRAPLTAMIDELIPLLQAADLDETPRVWEILRRLYDLLIRPIEDLLPSSPEEVVTVIPHGPLFRLPFAALRFGDSDDDYLVHRWALSYGSSIATLAQLSGRPQPGTRDLLALVNPDPMPEGWSVSLPATERHFLALSRFYREPATLVREQATESAFKRLAGRPSVLYLGTHGFAERAGPIETAIVLARDAENNGFLEPSEVYALELDAELVMLAACQTGRGKLRGDGVLGLARAFFAAGARAMLASLWQVPEELTLDQTVDFHHHWLNESQPKAVALQRAQSHAAGNDPLQPVLWAGLILAGEWQ